MPGNQLRHFYPPIADQKVSPEKKAGLYELALFFCASAHKSFTKGAGVFRKYRIFIRIFDDQTIA
jgi:hypothetical protein